VAVSDPSRPDGEGYRGLKLLYEARLTLWPHPPPSRALAAASARLALMNHFLEALSAA
jgi:hypothetical protein